MPPRQHFNAVVLGAGGVGKSALTVRFGRNQFVEQYNPTIEEEYTCNMVIDGVPCVLDILDTPGMEQFTALNEGYIKGGRGFLLVFSLTQEASLKDVDDIRQLIYQIKGDKTVPIVVVGTKLDLTHEREVSRSTIQDLAMRWGLPFYETSAKRNWHVSIVFEDLVRQMRKRYPPGELSPRKRKREECVVM
ncbi:Ras-related protein [Sparassis crispa]|uniref:Ras-related protein n=1 Tax=Sparassis crispa TaxID=139825 RepID=A0A401H226_9APHY|nr:Ras-related protein [Sparassis crispa]GBE88442.1 Ras-related protein [Sparassis crispa]